MQREVEVEARPLTQRAMQGSSKVFKDPKIMLTEIPLFFTAFEHGEDLFSGEFSRTVCEQQGSTSSLASL